VHCVVPDFRRVAPRLALFFASAMIACSSSHGSDYRTAFETSTERLCACGADVTCAVPEGYYECVSLADEDTLRCAAAAEEELARCLGGCDLDACLADDPCGLDASITPCLRVRGIAPPRETCTAPLRDVDLLVLLDTSTGSSIELTDALDDAIVHLQHQLFEGTIESVHLAFVTPDLGVGGYPIPSCEDSGLGDDGVFVSRCELPPVLTVDRLTDLDELRESLHCAFREVARTGCGVEQPLEATLKAVTPSGVLPFLEGEGHGDGANDGFLRDDALFVVWHVTEEDDCSPSEADFWDTTDHARFAIRCVERADQLHPTSRYVDGYLASKRDPRALLYALTAGVPEDLGAGAVCTAGSCAPLTRCDLTDDPRGTCVADEPRALLDAALADPRTEPRIDGLSLERVCSSPIAGATFAPARLLEVAGGLRDRGAHVTLASICGDSLFGAAHDLATHILSAAEAGACTRR